MEPDRSLDPWTAYAAARERHQGVLDTVGATVRRIEAARLTSFLVAALVGALYAELPIGRGPSIAIASAAALVFLVLVFVHRRLRRVVRRAEIGVALAALGEARLSRAWSDIAEALDELGAHDPLVDAAAIDEDHAYVADLDVFGPASLRSLLGPTPSPTGSATLRSWLTAPSTIPEIERRQGAVRSLAPDFEGRETLATASALVGAVPERQWSRFLAWLHGAPVFGSGAAPLPGWSIWVARLMPPVTISLAIVDAMLGAATSAWIWGAPLAVQSVLALRWGRALSEYLDSGSGSSVGLRRYHALFHEWERYPATDESIRSLIRSMSGEEGAPASVEIRRLERWLDAADSRASMLHVFVAWGLFWDVHVAYGLEGWRRGAGARVEQWFHALGELEGLTALATLAHDHPDWCYPSLHHEAPGLEGEALGHPMLSESVLRTSDVTVEPPGRFLLVTGSNMSGKSTLLRSIGLAAVMAQAGSVVCARRLSLSPLRVFTSMRIHDSLTAGVSHFMAELRRLKSLVDAADRPSDEPALLYLIDEVLQGTNSEERRIAARHIVSHLLAMRAVGAVTTHDLSLHEDARLDAAAAKVHFRETVGDPASGALLSFDYELRPGLATSRNALKLLEVVGLGDSVGRDEVASG